jgi:hypothetical protein
MVFGGEVSEDEAEALVSTRERDMHGVVDKVVIVVSGFSVRFARRGISYKGLSTKRRAHTLA